MKIHICNAGICLLCMCGVSVFRQCVSSVHVSASDEYVCLSIHMNCVLVYIVWITNDVF